MLTIVVSFLGVDCYHNCCKIEADGRESDMEGLIHIQYINGNQHYCTNSVLHELINTAKIYWAAKATPTSPAPSALITV